MTRINIDIAEWWNKVAPDYARSSTLFGGEQLILERFRDQWSSFDMLDLGVGGGRTALHFAPICRTYTGLDISPKMIECTRARVQESENIHFDVADARDLSRFRSTSFEFILFSYNGIDYIHPDDRPVVLREIKRLLKPNGHLLFSSHSLSWLPLDFRPLPSLDYKKPLHYGWRFARTIFKNSGIKRINRKLDLDSAWQKGWVFTPDGGENSTLQVAYVSPLFQMQQLRTHGFLDIELFDDTATPVDPEKPPRLPWINYLCRS